MKSQSTENYPVQVTSHSASAGFTGIVAREFRRLFGIDVRSLAAFRIGLALILIVDLLERATDLEAHYCDSGVLPRSAVIAFHHGNLHPSFHLISGAWAGQAILFGIAGLFAACLLIGYRTRVATIASWMFLLSLHARNPLVLTGGDGLLRNLLFWAMFLPLGACCSLDGWRRTRNLLNPKPIVRNVLSCGTIAILLQICMMYWFASLLKTDPIWTVDGSAIYYALSVDQLTRPLGQYLLNFPDLLRFLSFSTLYLEGLGPCLFFLPFLARWTRPIAVGMFASFHLGIYLTMSIGFFPWVCWTGLMLFLPGTFWDFIFSKLGRLRSCMKTPILFHRLATRFGVRQVQTPRPERASAMTWKNFSNVSVCRFAIGNLMAVVFLVLTVNWNLRSIDREITQLTIPKTTNNLLRLVGLDQKWNMFAPFPAKNDGWFMVPAVLSDGTEVDLMTGRAVTDTKPDSVLGSFRNERCRKYIISLIRHRPARRYYGRYLKRKWNNEHRDDSDQQLVSFKIFFWEEYSMVDTPSRLRKRQLWTHFPLGPKNFPPERVLAANATRSTFANASIVSHTSTDQVRQTVSSRPLRKLTPKH